MNKVELADKLYKHNHSKKREANRIETTGKKSEKKKDSVSLSSKSVSLSGPKASKNNPDTSIRMDLVKKFKEDINKGTYEVKTNEIAEKIIQKYKEQVFLKPFP